VSRTQRQRHKRVLPGRVFDGAMVLHGVVRCRAGAVTNASVWYGPGSAERHEECRTAVRDTISHAVIAGLDRQSSLFEKTLCEDGWNARGLRLAAKGLRPRRRVKPRA